MNQERINNILQDIATCKADIKSAHKQLDENKALIDQIHKLAGNIENLALQVKNQTTQNEKMFAGLDEKIKTQCERIKKLEGRSSKREECVVTALITAIVTAIVMFVAGKFGFNAQLFM